MRRALASAAPATFALMLASSLATMIALGALALAASRDYFDTLQGAEVLSQQVARLVEEHTQRYVRAPEQALRRLDERFRALSLAEMTGTEVQSVADAIAAELPQVGAFFIVDPEGQVVMVSSQGQFGAVQVKDREYFRAHMAEGRMDTVIGPLIRARGPVPAYGFTISRPLVRGGKVVGIVAAFLNLEFFTSFYASLNLGPDAICSIFNEEAWMVARFPLGDEFLSRQFKHLGLFTERQTRGDAGTFVRNGTLDGKMRVFSYRKVAGLPLSVVAGLPLDGVMAAWEMRLVRNAAIVVGLLGLVQGALWLTWRAMKRERALAAGLRRALDDNVTLFNEIHHRVKNNMQIVSSMLMIEQIRAGSGPLAERLQLVAERVSSMALVHTMLYERHEVSRVDVSAYLTELCRNLAEGHGTAERRIHIQVTADDTFLAVEHAVPLGLLVNEAVANALKHAFPDGRPGTIAVDFAGDGCGGFSLSVADDGVGYNPQPRGNGIGTTIMRSLAGQLDASTKLAAHPSGTGTVLQVWRGQAQPAMPALEAA